VPFEGFEATRQAVVARETVAMFVERTMLCHHFLKGLQELCDEIKTLLVFFEVPFLLI
jgi:acetylornithine/succinyldiaminopimelate/putrescine aminotransferase